MADKKYTPILPFDGTIGENFIIYNNQTYHQDINYITADNVKKDSGNIIKYYRCSDVKTCYVGETRPEEYIEDSEETGSEQDFPEETDQDFSEDFE